MMCGFYTQNTKEILKKYKNYLKKYKNYETEQTKFGNGSCNNFCR